MQLIKKLTALTAIAITCQCTTLLAQDPHFTQFYAGPLYMNPASAGNAICDETPAGRATAQYRNQWPGLTGNYKTFNLSMDQPFDIVHGGIGVQYVRDNQGSGIITSQSLMTSYSRAAKLNDKLRLRIGFQFGLANRTLDLTKLRFADQLDSLLHVDPDNTAAVESITYPSIATGFLLSGKNFYVGGAVFNLNQPNWSFYRNPNEFQPKRITLHGGYTFKIKDGFSLIPQVQFMKQAIFGELLLGSNAQIKNFIAGMWYRKTLLNYRNGNAEAIAVNLGYQTSAFRVIYSYDLTISDARSAYPSSHEITLSFTWKTQQKHAAFSVPE